MGATSIQWTDFSTNPIRARLRRAAVAAVSGATTALRVIKGGYNSGVGHYCEKISPGCAFCYASKTQPRFGMPAFPGARKGGRAGIQPDGTVPVSDDVELFFDDARLLEVIRRRKPTRFFWCDMTDLFGAWVPDVWIDRCFAAMALSPQHTHQVLTKRPERMAEYIARAGNSIDFIERPAREMGYTLKFEGHGLVRWPLPNVWLGTSVENQKAADERIPHLLGCPAAVRFLSCEPLLGPIQLRTGVYRMPITGETRTYRTQGTTLDGISWVIVGGESGHGARPCNVEWVRDIVRQCRAAGVPAFVKQMGAALRMTFPEWNENWQCSTDKHGFTLDGPDAEAGIWRGVDPKGGEPSEWSEDLRVRELPAAVPANG